MTFTQAVQSLQLRMSYRRDISSSVAARARRTRQAVTVVVDVHSVPDAPTRCWMKAFDIVGQRRVIWVTISVLKFHEIFWPEIFHDIFPKKISHDVLSKLRKPVKVCAVMHERHCVSPTNFMF